MLERFKHLLPGRAPGPGGHIIAAVVMVGTLLVAATVPLVNGLDKNARLAKTVSTELVPNAIRVNGLVGNLMEAQSALEGYLLTGNEAERQRFQEVMEMVHVTLEALEKLPPPPGFESSESVLSLITGISDLVIKLEGQADEVFALHDAPDNVASAYLINTRGEKLLTRTYAYVDMITDAWFTTEPDESHIFLSALMGYQDSLGRMTSSVRGYLFQKEERFRQQYQRELARNENIYQLIELEIESAGPAAQAFFKMFAATRLQLLQVFDRAFAERDTSGWRQDFVYYHTRIVPTLDSLKWVLTTLSDTTSQGISEVSTDGMSYGFTLRDRTAVGAIILLAIAGLAGLWIYRWVRVFTNQIGQATVDLKRLSGRLKEETGRQGKEADNQVNEISGIFQTLTGLKEALNQIRKSTEDMAQQTDAASLECVQGMEVLSEYQQRMDDMLQQARHVSEAMEETRRQTELMDGILLILNELVDQTKLLSFNATIEAAGAGRSGTRFAVVAKQVRRLATRSREATKEIRDMIHQVQQTAERTRQATEQGTATVMEGESLMAGVTERLDVIVEAVSQVSDMAGSIFLATQAQTRSVTEVDSFVGEAKETATRVAKRSGDSIKTAGELDRTARQLARLAGR